MKIRYRWEGPPEDAPTLGCYLLAPQRPRYGYLILAVKDRGRRGGLGRPIFTLLAIDAERVPVSEARAGERCYPIVWDHRG